MRSTPTAALRLAVASAPPASAAVQLSITNEGTVTYEDSPGNSVMVIDGEGQQYLAGYFEATAGPGFDGDVTILPGDTRVGFVVFEVPTTAKTVKMQMALGYGFAEDVGEFAPR